MHEEIDDKFDLLVRSMMEDAEEEVPSGMWELIESRLPQKSPAIVWWKRLGIIVASCAVIVSAFVLTGTFDKTDDINIVSKTEYETVAQAVKPDLSTPATPQEIRNIKASISKRTDRVSGDESFVAIESTAEKISLPEETSAAASETEKANISSKKTSGSRTVKSEAGDKTKQTYEQEWSSFIAQEKTEEHTIKRISADVRSSFGSNDNISNKRNGPDWMAAPTILGNANTGIIESGESFYSIPVTFGVGARLYFTDRFSAGIGINYSILTRSFTGTYQKASEGLVTERIPDADITHKMSYIGIPVNLYLDILQTDLLRFYTFVGGTAEKCLSNKYKIRGDAGQASMSESVNGLQWSAAFGLGIQFNLSERTGLYLDPNARYYFDCRQPKNIRTQKPFMFNIEAGIRFNL